VNHFHTLKHRRALVPFLMLGDPSLEQSLTLIKSAIDAGADALELGLPFSSSLAESPVIQRSAERALKHIKYRDALHLLQELRLYTDIPIGVLTYCNPLWHRGMAHALAELSAVGVDAVLIADLSFEAAKTFESVFAMHHVGQIFLIAPNTDPERAALIHQSSTGFSYIVDVMGTAGVREGVSEATLTRLQALKPLNAAAPLIVGSGIQEPKQVQALWDAGADGVIIGSRLIQCIEDHLHAPDLALQEIRALIKRCKE